MTSRVTVQWVNDCTECSHKNAPLESTCDQTDCMSKTSSLYWKCLLCEHTNSVEFRICTHCEFPLTKSENQVRCANYCKKLSKKERQYILSQLEKKKQLCKRVCRLQSILRGYSVRKRWTGSKRLPVRYILPEYIRCRGEQCVQSRNPVTSRLRMCPVDEHGNTSTVTLCDRCIDSYNRCMYCSILFQSSESELACSYCNCGITIAVRVHEGSDYWFDQSLGSGDYDISNVERHVISVEPTKLSIWLNLNSGYNSRFQNLEEIVLEYLELNGRVLNELQLFSTNYRNGEPIRFNESVRTVFADHTDSTRGVLDEGVVFALLTFRTV